MPLPVTTTNLRRAGQGLRERSRLRWMRKTARGTPFSRRPTRAKAVTPPPFLQLTAPFRKEERSVMPLPPAAPAPNSKAISYPPTRLLEISA